MTLYVTSQILSAIITLTYFYSLFKKNNENMFFINFIENTLTIVKNAMLGGYSSVAVLVFGSLNLYLGSKGKFKGRIVFISVSLQVITSLIVNKDSIIGYIPIVASSGYYLLITIFNKNIQIKILLIINLILWVIYYILLSDYIGALANTLSIIFTSAVVVKQLTDEKSTKI